MAVSNFELKKEFESLLDKFNCDLFFNTTFRDTTKMWGAVNKFKYFFKHLNTPKQVFFDKYILCWTFFEKEDCRNGVHIHSLIKGWPENLFIQ